MWGEYSDNYQLETWENFQYNENISQEPVGFCYYCQEFCYYCQPKLWEHYHCDGYMSQIPVTCHNYCNACTEKNNCIIAFIEHTDKTMGETIGELKDQMASLITMLAS